MAVVVRYAVIRKGVEAAVFTSKEEADIYDARMDAADALIDILSKAGISVPDEQLEQITDALTKKAIEVTEALKPVLKLTMGPRVYKPRQSRSPTNDAPGEKNDSEGNNNNVEDGDK